MDNRTVTELAALLEEADKLITEFNHRLGGSKFIPSVAWEWRSVDWLRDYNGLRDRLRQSLKVVQAGN